MAIVPLVIDIISDSSLHSSPCDYQPTRRCFRWVVYVKLSSSTTSFNFGWPACCLWIWNLYEDDIRCVRKKNLQFFLNNRNKFKLIFPIFGTHYPRDTFYSVTK